MSQDRPRLLDLYSGAGGSAMGYSQAGFAVTGVDIKPQPHYPFAFIQADALEYLAEHGREYDAIHASPPCQRYCQLRAMWNHGEYPDLIGPTREILRHLGKPYVIENVPSAPLEHPVMLCGSMFRLGCEGGELRRHRLFETSFPVLPPSGCAHGWSGEEGATVGVYGHAGGYSARQRYCTIRVYGGHGQDKRRRKNGQHFPTAARAEAMGIDWMTGAELTQAIPPAYTRFIGEQLIRALRHEAGGPQNEPGMASGLRTDAGVGPGG